MAATSNRRRRGGRRIKASTTEILFGSRAAFKGRELASSVQKLKFPASSEDFPSFLEEMAKNGEQIESIFMSTKPSSNLDLCKFMATRPLFSNLTTLVITGSGKVDEGGFEIPIEVMTELLRGSPQLKTLEILNYVRIGESFSVFSMFSFCQALRLHSSLRNFKFEPMAQIKIHRTVCEYTRRLVGRPYHDGFHFNLNLILDALAETPNLQLLCLRPSLYDVENDDYSFYRCEGGDDIDLYQEIPLASLTKLCSNPALLELEIDFRSEWSKVYGDPRFPEKHKTYSLTVQSSSDHERFTEALESSSLTKFIYRHMSTDTWYNRVGDNTDEPITLDVIEAIKNNSNLNNVCVEQQSTRQKPGIARALTEVLRESSTLVELHLPFLRLCDDEKSSDMQPIAESLKDNQTLQVLNLRGSNFSNTDKGVFEDVLTSDPFAVVYNSTLLRLETGDCEEGEMKDDDSRDYCYYDHCVNGYSQVADLALVLNRAGRGKLSNGVTPTKTDLVAALSKIPSVCRDFPLASGETWFEPEDITSAHYYFLRKFPGVWSPSKPSHQAVSVTAVPPKKKKRKRTPAKKKTKKRTRGSL